MLVLTRRVGQSIMIGDPLKPEDCYEVQVVKAHGDEARIGVKAARDISVDRSEIREAKQRER